MNQKLLNEQCVFIIQDDCFTGQLKKLAVRSGEAVMFGNIPSIGTIRNLTKQKIKGAAFKKGIAFASYSDAIVGQKLLCVMKFMSFGLYGLFTTGIKV